MTLEDVRFLSPEQAIGDPANPRSDVYALALILYEAVTGITPFDGVTPEAVLRARINATLPMRPELGTLGHGAGARPGRGTRDPRLRARRRAVRQSPRGRRERLRAAGHRAGSRRGARCSAGTDHPNRETRSAFVLRRPIKSPGPPRSSRRSGAPSAPRHARPADEWVASEVRSVRGRVAFAATTTTWTTRVCHNHADWCSWSRPWSCSSWPSVVASPGRSACSAKTTRYRTSSASISASTRTRVSPVARPS